MKSGNKNELALRRWLRAKRKPERQQVQRQLQQSEQLQRFVARSRGSLHKESPALH